MNRQCFGAMAALPPHVGSTDVGTALVDMDASDLGGDDFWQASFSSNAPFDAQSVHFGFTEVLDADDSLRHNSTVTPLFVYEFVSFYFACQPDV